ncbi:hypothetical protein GPECTOR_20g452 [Gonium pectorale]|uniref:Uncharacterized protein n=1 Tax=Gonium pectorale TaxID=33097 RepID=A0A150GIE7_GONPE|nr:hypothetical protein GPECTOR_20g452 [Gonium pectorale]|eukprot:KXZ49596.1 hypothetical protein GPECTOR_20g452 [Gonium pectorale]
MPLAAAPEAVSQEVAAVVISPLPALPPKQLAQTQLRCEWECRLAVDHLLSRRPDCQLLAARGVRLTYSDASMAARAGRVEALAGLLGPPGYRVCSPQRVKVDALYGGHAGLLRRLMERYGVMYDMERAIVPHGIFDDLEVAEGGGAAAWAAAVSHAGLPLLRRLRERRGAGVDVDVRRQVARRRRGAGVGGGGAGRGGGVRGARKRQVPGRGRCCRRRAWMSP